MFAFTLFYSEKAMVSDVTIDPGPSSRLYSTTN